MKTYYTIYKITNNINGKIYIGMHQTKNLNDGYMGSGKLIGLAIKKYSIENFTKEYIAICDDRAEMIDLEKELVNENFVSRDDTYNLSLGGVCGEDNASKGGTANWKKLKSDPIAYKRFLLKQKLRRTPEAEVKRLKSLKITYENGFENGFKGKHHTAETKRKIGIASSKRESGKNNSQYGKHKTEKQKHQIRQALKNKPIITCPHCGFKNNNKGSMTRWHNDNCKYR